jgi:hypothetical protein
MHLHAVEKEKTRFFKINIVYLQIQIESFSINHNGKKKASKPKELREKNAAKSK